MRRVRGDQEDVADVLDGHYDALHHVLQALGSVDRPGGPGVRSTWPNFLLNFKAFKDLTKYRQGGQWPI